MPKYITSATMVGLIIDHLIQSIEIEYGKATFFHLHMKKEIKKLTLRSENKAKLVLRKQKIQILA